MNFQETITYQFSIQDLIPILTNPDFLLAKYDAQGARNIKLISKEISEHRSEICIQRDIPVEVEIPAFARSIVPSGITLIQTDSWDKLSHTGTLDIKFKGMPVKLTCDMKMLKKGNETLQTLDFYIQVNVPLIGRKLEDLLARDLMKKFKNDTLVTNQIIKQTMESSEVRNESHI
ncbi:MAG: DUF2505 domain-containing protein [Moraxellaceae bacterium]